MDEPEDIGGAAQRYDQLCREKAEAELAAADALVPGSARIRWAGDALAEIMLVKGGPGAADRAAGRALSGADGEAADKALDALGLPAERFAMCSRPGRSNAASRLTRLALSIEAVDPRTVIALDPEAAADVALACGLERLEPGKVVLARGRSVLALDGLEASLGDERLKRRAWRQLQALGVTAPGTSGERP